MIQMMSHLLTKLCLSTRNLFYRGSVFRKVHSEYFKYKTVMYQRLIAFTLPFYFSGASRFIARLLHLFDTFFSFGCFSRDFEKKFFYALFESYNILELCNILTIFTTSSSKYMHSNVYK